MADKYYLMSKDIGDGPYLIGELTRLGRGQYQFRYMIRGSEFPRWFMPIPGLRETGRTYGTRDVLNCIIYRLVPVDGSWGADVLMRQNGVSQYDEWVLLESLIAQHNRYKSDTSPLCDSHQLFFFYEEIPLNINRFD